MSAIKTVDGDKLPPFLSPDARIPAAIRELLLEADGCLANGYYNGATACAQRAIDALLRVEKVEGASHEARIRALGEKISGMPALLLSVLTQLSDAATRDAARLPTNTLHLLLVTLKAATYEVYVVGAERAERLQHVRKLLESADKKAEQPVKREATPATLASMGASGT